jgi:hypothetical protein
MCLVRCLKEESVNTVDVHITWNNKLCIKCENTSDQRSESLSMMVTSGK